jgi:hypothetical protein
MTNTNSNTITICANTKVKIAETKQLIAMLKQTNDINLLNPKITKEKVNK